MNARSIPSPDALEELDQLVARIRARGAGEVLPRPSEEAIRQFIERLANEPVMSDAELAEWTAEWAVVEKEMRDRDHADDVAEGRAGE